MITQGINLNLIPGQVLPRVNVSQYDNNSRTLQMALYDGAQAFNIASGMSCAIQGTKPDHRGFQYACTVTEGTNVVTAEITQQMTAVSGDVVCELVIMDGTAQIATVNFIICVEKAALADDTVVSDTQIPLIEQAAEAGQIIPPLVDDAEQYAEDSEAWAQGTRDGEAVPPTDPTYHNNAKYYAEQAQLTDLGDLHDVELTSLANGDEVTYDSDSGKWINTGRIKELGSEIQALTNQLAGEANTRAKLGAHNLIPMSLDEMKSINTQGTWNGNVCTVNGVTYTVNTDNNGNVTGVTIGGTLTGSASRFLLSKAFSVDGAVKLNGGVSSNLYMQVVTSDEQTEITSNTSGDTTINSFSNYIIRIIVKATVSQTVYPMLRYASDSVNTFTPYAKTNVELTKEIDGEVVTRTTLGAHNFCPNEIEAGTYQSVVITNNDDGSSSITGSIATTDPNVGFVVAKDILLKAGKYVLSGIPDNIQAGYGYVQAYVTTTAGTDLSWADRGSDKSLAVKTLANDTHVKVSLVMYHTNAQTFNFTYKPMIALASDPSKEFTPYAKTNRELTDDASLKSLVVTLDTDYISRDVTLYKKGGVVQFTLSALKDNIPIGQSTTLGTISDASFRPCEDVTLALGVKGGNIIPFALAIDTAGVISVYRYTGTVGTGSSINTSVTATYVTA